MGTYDSLGTFKSVVDRSVTEITADMILGLTNIRNNIFNHCSALQSVTIPNSVIRIGPSVFTDCIALSSVTVNATTPPSIGPNAFLRTSNLLVIYVPAESVDTYKAASGWLPYANKIQAIPSI